MNIAFVLPNTTDRAIGGYKVVYQYANYMVKSGHTVSVIYDEEQMIGNHNVLVRPMIKARAQYFLMT